MEGICKNAPEGQDNVLVEYLMSQLVLSLSTILCFLSLFFN